MTYLVRGTSEDCAELLRGREVTRISLRASDQFVYARFATELEEEIRLSKKSPLTTASKLNLSMDRGGIYEADISFPLKPHVRHLEAVTATTCAHTRVSSGFNPESVEDIAAGDDRYKAKYAHWFPKPAELPEVEDTPDSLKTPYPLEPPKTMLRLRSQWMKDHSEVWQTAVTSPGRTRSDVVGLVTKSFTM
ncbi:hypothetical protein BD309DRAFT_966144 [Dichomitus squalens]|nr:hypothetical protein BD309DRAFT_966144 [Dichomitus squalens]